MPSIDELLTDQFYRWELRGRGWFVFDSPVAVEPPFRPFTGHFLPPPSEVDDGRRTTVGSRMLGWLSEALSPAAPPPEEPEEEAERLIVKDPRPPLIELQVFLPAALQAERDAFEQFLLSLSACREQIAFEIVALAPHVTVQFAAHPSDAGMLRSNLESLFPDAVFRPEQGTLEAAWRSATGRSGSVVEFGLDREFMLPLLPSRAEIALGITGAFADLEPGEAGVFQVLFQPVRRPWAESVLVAVTDGEGGPFFINAPEFLPGTRRKVSRPLFTAVVRAAVRASTDDRVQEFIRRVGAALSPLADPNGNRLIALSNDEYAAAHHEEDFLRRQTRRCGMILNSDELTALVRLPSPAVRSDKLRRQTTRTKRAPQSVLREHGLALGENPHGGKSATVRLSLEERVRHMHVIGASGTGKSTLLFNLIRQGIEAGEGLALLDPHGDLVDRVLEIVPKERVGDVIVIDPSDEEYAVGFNVLSAHSEIEKTLLASDLVSVFERLSTSWGDQMGSVLRNAILAFLESPRGGTLADVRRFLLESDFRAAFLDTVTDPDVVYYWKRGFAQLSGGKSIGPVLTRLETFLSPKPIRYMVSQRENRLDFARIMDGGKILLAKLAQGAIGKENSYLLGTLLVSKFQQTAMSRQQQEAGERRPFFLYVDEFHNFITPSMAEILSGARKYGLGLVLAHQELHQLERDREVMSAILSNPCVRISFRVGDRDAETLEEGFAYFEARDLQNLNQGEAVVRVERSDQDFNLSVPLPQQQDAQALVERRREVVEASRRAFGKTRREVEAELRAAQPAAALAPKSPTPPAPPGQPKAPPPPPTPVPAATTPAVAPPVPPMRKEPTAPAKTPDLGKGGAQHKALQLRLKGIAEALGFAVTIEKQILQGAESVDVLIERHPLSIACEISVTTTVDHEVGNVAKCLRTDFSQVAVIAMTEDKLRKIEVGVRTALGAAAATRVGYYLPDDFIAHLQTLAVPAPSETRHGKFTVKRAFIPLSAEQAKARERVAAESLVAALKRKKRKD
jgi:hypothetical protein